MSYTVEYNPELRKLYPIKHSKRQKSPIKFLLYTLCVFVCLYILKIAGILRYIIPGEPAVTAGAFSEMVERVRMGQTVSDAIITLLKEVIIGGMRQ